MVRPAGGRTVVQVKKATHAERSLAARIGAYARAARYDGRTVTQSARAAFATKFEDQVDPDRVLPPAERARRAEAARREHMTRLALASVKARRARAARNRT